MEWWRRALMGSSFFAIATVVGSGCSSLSPRNFRDMLHPAPVVRAGAVGMGDDQPDAIAIPAWITRLDDKDAVVRMTANESLKKRSGQDFGFVPWAEAEERAPAVAKWKTWWQSQAQAKGLVSAQPDGAQPGLSKSRKKR
jgi:hypothetical protein